MDNQKLWDKADSAAVLYCDFERKSLEKKKLTTKPGQLVKEALEASSKKKFIESNTPIVQSATTEAERISELVKEVNVMPEDSFRYFLTLMKFRFFYHKAKDQGEKDE